MTRGQTCRAGGIGAILYADPRLADVLPSPDHALPER